MFFSFAGVFAVHAVFPGTRESSRLSVPARDLEGGAENLGSHEFRHGEGFLWLFGGGRWEEESG